VNYIQDPNVTGKIYAPGLWYGVRLCHVGVEEGHQDSWSIRKGT
jgi:hypothetical protein